MIVARMEWQDGSRTMTMEISVPEKTKPSDLPDLQAMVSKLIEVIDASPLGGLFVRPIGPIT